MLKRIGERISRIGDVIREPRLVRLRLHGIDVRMFESLNRPWLLSAGIETIFDVGANTGQFARVIHELLPKAYIYSFEPLGDCFTELQKTMTGVKNFQAFNTALAERDGEAEFYRSAWSPSSSLLRMKELHKQLFPFSAGESRETVQLRRLDDFIGKLRIENEILVKLDVQGAEDKVIGGGQGLLKRAKFLIVETSVATLYDGQPLFGEILKLLESQGFTYKGVVDQAFSPLDGSVLYADSLFARNT
jgi:FkbM family methyltransferase